MTTLLWSHRYAEASATVCCAHYGWFWAWNYTCMRPTWRLCGMQHKRQKLSVPSPPRDIPKAKPRLRVPSPPPVPVPTHSDRKAAKRKQAKGGGSGTTAGAEAASTDGFVNLYAADVRALMTLICLASKLAWAAQQYQATQRGSSCMPAKPAYQASPCTIDEVLGGRCLGKRRCPACRHAQRWSSRSGADPSPWQMCRRCCCGCWRMATTPDGLSSG